MIVIPKALARLADLAGPPGDAGRYALAAVLIERELVDHVPWYRLTCTDGRSLGISRGESMPADKDSTTFLDQEFADQAPSFLLPVGAWKEAMKLGGKEKPVMLGLMPDGALIGVDCVRSQSPPLDGHFPDYRQRLPKGLPLAQANVCPVRLAKLLQVYASQCQKGDPGRLTLMFYGDGQPVGLMGQTEHGFFDGLLMPLGAV